MCEGISEFAGSQGWHRSHNVMLDEAPSAAGNSDDAVGFLGGLKGPQENRTITEHTALT